MSRKDGILDLVVKAAPFCDLESGAKLEEYRGSQWAKKILSERGAILRRNLVEFRELSEVRGDFFPYHTARISLGYAHNRESFTRKIKRIRWGKPNPAWTYGIVSAGECFIIELEAPE